MKAIKTFFTLSSILFVLAVRAQTFIAYNTDYQYLKASSPIAIDGWQTANYDDSGWSTGDAPFWYGDGSAGTVLDDMRYNYSTFFLRKKFEVTDITGIDLIKVNIDYDDGFVLWINGNRVLERNAPVDLDKNSYSTGLRESGFAEAFSLSLDESGLVVGENLLAIQVLNANLTSSDIHFNMEMSTSRRLQDSVQVEWSHKAGFYQDPFTLNVSVPEGYLLNYTVDGSNPASSSAAIQTTNTVSILVDPTSTSNRAATAGFVVKVAVSKDGYAASFPESRTFLFVNQVKNQKNIGAPWPQDQYINGQLIDLEVGDDIVTSSKYGDSIEFALKDIPTLSVTTDMENLFNPQSGIFVNAWAHGPEWERDCSFELLNPDGSEGFSVNAGLRMRGGFSRNGGNPKHAFRLFFKSEYGDAKLKYPLFENEGIDEFDKIDLRTAQNYSWSFEGGENKRNTFIRDVFSRDLQGAMGQPFTKSRYYHLYLNGLYWGLFQTQERAESNFAESYFGGKDENYDVIKVTNSTSPYQVEATEGNIDQWEEIYDLTTKGSWTDHEYFFLSGKDANGSDDPNAKVWIEMDNLIDYMLIVFYTGDFDSPMSSFAQNMPNNFYAIDDRTDDRTGFRFFEHDSEHSLMYEPIFVGKGISEDRVNMYMNVPSVTWFHPQYLHNKLTQSPEYRQRFSDRAERAFGPNGLFDEGALKNLFDKRAEQIDQAIIAESARWGDSKVYPSRTKDDWLVELDKIRTEFFPKRGPIVVDQLVRANLYQQIRSPKVTVNGNPTNVEDYLLTGTLTVIVEDTENQGNLYLTLNGRDPRSIGGGLDSEVFFAKGNFTISELESSTVINARVKIGENWGPLRTIHFIKPQTDFSTLRITELHYHPKEEIIEGDTIDGDDYEFVEFYNEGSEYIELTGLTIDSAISYTFPEGAILLPGTFYVIADKPEKFYERYGTWPDGNYQKNLSNKGEQFVMVNYLGDIVLDFTYSDAEPWPEEADGTGNSLVWAGKGNDPNLSIYWRASAIIHGTPFLLDVFEPSHDASLKRILVNNELIEGFDPTIFNYAVEVPRGMSIPVISAISSSQYAKVIMSPATAIPGSTVISVLAEDGNTVLSYEISFDYGGEILGTKSNIVEFIYPNPVKEQLHFTYPIIGLVEITDIQGKVMLSKTFDIQTEMIDVKKLKPGMYFLQISQQNTTLNHRFIKE